MYCTRKYEYSEEYIDKIKKDYLKTGASAIISKKDIINAFDNPRCQHTIGRQENGNFVSSMFEDIYLVYDKDGQLKSSDIIEKIKGAELGKYEEGVYQYSYSPELVNNCEKLNCLRVVNGDNPGANSLNIPGCRTWAGKNIEYSETELLMPSVYVQGFESAEVFAMIENKGYFEIINPVVVVEDGNKVQVEGIFRISKLGG